MSDGVVLDASAVLAYLLNEPGADDVEAAFAEARASDSLHPITTVNWAEVLYNAARRTRFEDVAAVVALVDELPVHVVDADRKLSLAAAQLKNDRRLGLADAYGAALAGLLDLPLMTADPDFDALAEDGLQVRRIR